jgi:hypothetical protein
MGAVTKNEWWKTTVRDMKAPPGEISLRTEVGRSDGESREMSTPFSELSGEIEVTQTPESEGTLARSCKNVKRSRGYMRKPMNKDTMANQNSPTLAWLSQSGEPVTREEFLNLYFLGDVPDTIDPEVEAEFPEQFRLSTLEDSDPEDGVQ